MNVCVCVCALWCVFECVNVCVARGCFRACSLCICGVWAYVWMSTCVYACVGVWVHACATCVRLSLLVWRVYMHACLCVHLSAVVLGGV